MRLRKLLIVSALFCGIIANAQNKELDPKIADKWLATISGDTITAGEFWYVFNKNAKADEVITKDSLKNYRKLYNKFLLRVQEAKELGYDTTEKFKKEFDGYKNQLAESYLKDKSVTEGLVQEAFERSQTDVEASHILIGIKNNLNPNDTMEAYRTILKVRKKAINGEDFSKLAKEFSTDPSAKQNGGYLGYFSAFRMVYPFENAAYNTKVGEISNPFRTRFGYHIVKVSNKRKAVGEIKVAHIMTVVKKDMTEKKKKAAEENINEIYTKLQNGEDFKILAKKFSEDMNTASKGGELPWFGPSKFVPEFENAAFALTDNGDYSKPVQTPYGWHIIKRLDKKAPASYEEVKNDIKQKVSRSDRAELSKTSVLNRIKRDYGFKENRKGIDGFFKYCDSTILSGKWQAPSDSKLKTKMFEFDKKEYTQKEFATYLSQTLMPKRGGDYKRLVNTSYQTWMENILKDKERSMLLTKYPEYGRLLKEYKEGIILFDLTSEKVWNKSVSDTAGLRKFHEENKSSWNWDERMNGTVYKCINAGTAKKVRKYLKKKKDDVFILDTINHASKLNVRVEAGVYQAKDRGDLNDVKFKKGISKVFEKDGSFIVLKVNDVLPVQPKKLGEVRGVVTAKYQDYLMKVWIKDLSEKYKIIYNEEVFNQLIP